MDIEKLLNELAPQIKQYEENRKEREDTGFNVFYLISDFYYRETFHGDILYALLSPKEKHDEGNLFVELFIDMVNKEKCLNKEKPLVEKDNYCKVQVEREYGTNDGKEMGRIDLLIIGENKHCIVIENKLNNAGDTYRQLPKYRKDLDKKGYKIDAFVYVPLDQNKEPDRTDWENEEIQFINQKLVVIPAYKIGKTNLIENWLKPALGIIHIKNEDVKFVIKHYIKLLNNLTIDIMDNKTIINTLLKEENFVTTMAILENYDAICNSVVESFIANLGQRVKEENIGILEYSDKNRITISFSKEPFWNYIIEYYSRTNQYWRYWIYSGEKALPKNIKKILPKELPNCPLGWDYFEVDKEWCYWNKANALRAMKDGSFVEFIIDELKNSTKRIHELRL